MKFAYLFKLSVSTSVYLLACSLACAIIGQRLVVTFPFVAGNHQFRATLHRFDIVVDDEPQIATELNSSLRKDFSSVPSRLITEYEHTRARMRQELPDEDAAMAPDTKAWLHDYALRGILAQRDDILKQLEVLGYVPRISLPRASDPCSIGAIETNPDGSVIFVKYPKGRPDDAVNFSIPYAIPMLVAALLPSLFVWRIAVACIRRRSKRCVFCGYDLRATPDRCPECGGAVRPAKIDWSDFLWAHTQIAVAGLIAAVAVLLLALLVGFRGLEALPTPAWMPTRIAPLTSDPKIPDTEKYDGDMQIHYGGKLDVNPEAS